MNRASFVAVMAAVLCADTPAQNFLAGGRPFALGGSSVAWHPSVGAIFGAPGELARIHQNEILVSTDRLKRLSSVAGAVFIPSVGTVAAGVGHVPGVSWYTAGYGGLVGAHHTLGGAINILVGSIEQFSVSLSGAMHFPGAAGQYSGIHVGASVVNLSAAWDELPSAAAAGAGFWVIPDVARVQGTWEYRGSRGKAVVGAEFRIGQDVSLQVGTRSFESMTAGLAVAGRYFSTELAAGRNSLACSFSFRIGNAASDELAARIERGRGAFDEERYAQAYELAHSALVYDEYSLDAKALADSSWARLVTAQENLLTRAQALEEQQKFPDALELYHRLQIIDPDHPEVPRLIAGAEERLRLYVEELLASGDSLRQRRAYDRARQRYEQAQQLAPDDQRPVERLAALRTSARENFGPLLDRARGHLRENRLDEAQRDFERVLTAEPGNRAARTGLEAIRSRRLDLQFERGKARFADADYIAALEIFMGVLESDERHRGAQEYLQRTRAILRPQVEVLFRAGLQYYLTDNYGAALDAWGKVLLIEPQHRDTLEYRRRAEEKMKALEQLERRPE